MAKFFVHMAESTDPQKEDLVLFLNNTVQLLGFLVNAPDLRQKLWRDDEKLQQLALVSFNADVIPAAEELRIAISKISEEELKRHGLTGTAARFKYNVIARLAKSWRRYKGQFTIGKTFRSLLEAVDAVLDSLISAAAGNGALIKEFKDVIMALAASR